MDDLVYVTLYCVFGSGLFSFSVQVLSRVERLNDAHGMYALNKEATTLVKISKDLEHATPITDEAVKMIEPLSRSNPNHVHK